MKSALLPLLLVALALVGTATSRADGGAAHRTKQALPIKLGTSGGSVADVSRAFCCGGTLGAAVTCGGALAVLSNNHVLARSGSAAAGEDVAQPGLIDTSCRSSNSNIVADFAGNLVPLGTANVDAAIAYARSGRVSASGELLDIGVPCATPAVATINAPVAKSGRTSGFTTGVVQAVNTTVSVQYQRGCNSGKKFTVTFTNQVTVTPGTFIQAGDSGSLMVTNDTNHQPVGLLYAGSSSVAIANPIQDVINAFTPACGTFAFVGGTCTTTGGTAPLTSLASSQIAAAGIVKERHAPGLMARAGILGVGVGTADDDPSEAVIVLYVEQGRRLAPLPKSLDGVRVKVVRTDPIVAM